MSMKRKVIGGSIIVTVLLVAGFGVYLLFGKESSEQSKDAVYVDKISTLMGLESGTGVPGRFGGVVESQEVWEVKQNAEKTVKEILVEVGQEVAVGTELFTYDTETMEGELSQAEIDLERIENEITTTNNQINQLEKEKKAASADDQLTYTTQIQTAQTEVKKKEYEKKSKAVEIEQIKTKINQSTVTSEIQGVVKSINQGTTQDFEGESESFLTVLATGNFRVKGKVNEQNLSAIIEGEPAIIRSRVDDTKTWSGTLTQIDVDNPDTSNSGMSYGYGMADSASETSTSYAFYVNLDAADGLLLGQHVYIEMNQGQDEEKAGVWIDEGYLCDIDSTPYVWADNGDGKLEKRTVILGQYDEGMCRYEITEGLDTEDAIAYPQEQLEEGAPTIINDASVMEDIESIPDLESEGTADEGGDAL